ncbi:MAG: hypothetical protein AAB316_13390 [Bacteroidota bacterium]
MKFKEGDLQFDFNENVWSHVLKFDETTAYGNAAKYLPRTKGVDFTGILENNSLVLMEVKDFRGHRIENKPKFMEGKKALWIQAASKYKNSIAVMVGAARNSTHEKEHFQAYLDLLKNEKKQLFLILWLEQDTPLATRNKKLKTDRQEYILLQQLKKSLKWLSAKVNIWDTSVNPFPKSLVVSHA